MSIPGPEAPTLNIIEAAFQSDNSSLRRIAITVTELREKAGFNTRLGAGEAMASLPPLYFGLHTGLQRLMQYVNAPDHVAAGPDTTLLACGLFILGSILAESAINTFNAAAIARGEVSALTVALATELIAQENTKNSKT